MCVCVEVRCARWCQVPYYKYSLYYIILTNNNNCNERNFAYFAYIFIFIMLIYFKRYNEHRMGFRPVCDITNGLAIILKTNGTIFFSVSLVIYKMYYINDICIRMVNSSVFVCIQVTTKIKQEQQKYTAPSAKLTLRQSPFTDHYRSVKKKTYALKTYTAHFG